MISSILNRLKLPHVYFILFAAGFLVYGNAIFHPFVHDDVAFIAQNPQIGNLDLKNIFVQLASPSGQSAIINTYYRPVLELYYRLVYHFFGLDPHAYHLINILLHVLNGCLVFALLCLIKPDKRTFNFFVALFFVIHPVQSEAVACISGVSNLLYGTFLLAGLYFYINSIRRSSVLYFCASAVFFFAGLWVKEQMIVFPFLAAGAGLLVAKPQKQSMGQTAVKLAVFAGIWVLYLFVRHQLLTTGFSTGIVFNGEFWLRVMTIPRTMLMYFQVMFFPFDLHYYRR